MLPGSAPNVMHAEINGSQLAGLEPGKVDSGSQCVVVIFINYRCAPLQC